jgi:predicted nucleic-acid-binding Zn-ribbon protein
VCQKCKTDVHAGTWLEEKYKKFTSYNALHLDCWCPNCDNVDFLEDSIESVLLTFKDVWKTQYREYLVRGEALREFLGNGTLACDRQELKKQLFGQKFILVKCVPNTNVIMKMHKLNL